MKLNMFRATHDPLLGAWKVVGHVVSTYEKPEAANAVLDSWWWAVCRPKHVELHINME